MDHLPSTLTLAAFLIASTGDAQSPTVELRALADNALGSIPSAVVSDINNDCTPDVIYLLGGELVVAYAPQIFSWRSHSGVFNLSDLTAIEFPCGSIFGSSGVLAVRDDSPPLPDEVLGPRLVQVGNSLFRQVPLNSTHPAWELARKVDAGPWIAALGEFTVAGLAPSTNQVVLGHWSPASPLSHDRVANVSNALDVIVADWDRGATLDFEAIVLRTDGVEAFDADAPFHQKSWEFSVPRRLV